MGVAECERDGGRLVVGREKRDRAREMSGEIGGFLLGRG